MNIKSYELLIKSESTAKNTCWDFASKTNNVFVPFAVRENFGNWPTGEGGVSGANGRITTSRSGGGTR